MLRLLPILVASLCVLVSMACDSDTERASRPDYPAVEGPYPYEFEKIDWDGCDIDGFECGSVRVPFDYADPEGAWTSIVVAKHEALDRESRIGVLFVNPGGPGSSAVELAFDAPYVFPRAILERFDIVGVDTRGIGHSLGLDCGDDADVDYTPDDDRERRRLQSWAARYAADCRLYGDFPGTLGTLTAARDLEAVRMALGEEEVSYFGFSYGTLLGAAYADQFPDRVRAMVLDSALDPTLSYDQRARDLTLAFEGALDAFLDQCSQRKSCDFYSDGDPHGAFDALLARVDEEPLDADAYRGMEATGEDLRWAVSRALYDRASWPELASTLAHADLDEDGTSIINRTYPFPRDGELPSSLHAGMAIRCLDDTWPDEAAVFHRLAIDLAAVAPHFGPQALYQDLPCVYWKAKSTPLHEFKAVGAPPILVIGATGDPATPYQWSSALADQLSSGMLLTYAGFIHGVSFTSTSDCIDEATLRYLIDLKAPSGLVCRD